MDKTPLTYVYSGAIIHSLSKDNLQIIENGLIAVSNGKIIYVGGNENIGKVKEEYNVKDEDVHELEKGQFVIPGFIDTHTHAPQYPNSGLGYDIPLLQWLDMYTFPLEKKFQDEKYARRVYEAFVKRMISNGTTTSSCFATIHTGSSIVLAKLAHKFGQRAFIGKVNMIKNSPPDYCETRHESVANTRLFIEEIKALNNHLIKPIITPRFALNCDMELMKTLGELAAEYDLPIQSHVSENLSEIEKVSEEYPECSNYVDVYDKAGLVTNKTVLAHGVHLRPEEISKLKEKRTAISHCPNSNDMLLSGLCPVRRLLNCGVKICLGTDCSGGYSCSMLDAMRKAMHTSVKGYFSGLGEKLTYAETFYLATLAGAEALSISKTTGNFQVGKDFDAIVVDMKGNPAVDILDEYTTEELFQKFIYLGDDRMMAKVYVCGRLIKNGNEYLTRDDVQIG